MACCEVQEWGPNLDGERLMGHECKRENAERKKKRKVAILEYSSCSYNNKNQLYVVCKIKQQMVPPYALGKG